jgi:hypothetical protein
MCVFRRGRVQLQATDGAIDGFSSALKVREYGFGLIAFCRSTIGGYRLEAPKKLYVH